MADTPCLPEELTVYTVAEVYPLCKAWAGDLAGDVLRVQAHQVAEVDGAGIQLLLSLRNTLAARQARLDLQRPSPALVSTCQKLGLEQLASATQGEGATP